MTHREFKPLQAQGELPKTQIQRILCGPEQTIAITQKSEVYVCGFNNLQQLGALKEVRVVQLTLAKDLTKHKLTQICCADSAAYGINNTGELFTWGPKSIE